MELPDDEEMVRIFQAEAVDDPQRVRDIILDPSKPLVLDDVHHALHDIVHGEASGEENLWYLTAEAQAWVSEHGTEITPSSPG
jgi:hypothetical protein